MSGWQETLQLEDCCGIRHTQAYNIARQLASRGVEIVQVLGWIVLRDNGKVYTKAAVEVR